MTTEERVSVNQVKALWALNELKSPRTSKHYHDSRAPAVFQKLGASTSPFVDSESPEFRMLVEMFEPARGQFLHMYFNGIKEFVLEQWTVEQIRCLNAMSQMDPSGRAQFISVQDYALSPPPIGADDGDPRVAAAKVPPSNTPFRTVDPVVIGLYNGLRVLIDGYCRSILFMRSAKPDSRIPVLVPVAA